MSDGGIWTQGFICIVCWTTSLYCFTGIRIQANGTIIQKDGLQLGINKHCSAMPSNDEWTTFFVGRGVPVLDMPGRNGWLIWEIFRRKCMYLIRYYFHYFFLFFCIKVICLNSQKLKRQKNGIWWNVCSNPTALTNLLLLTNHLTGYWPVYLTIITCSLGNFPEKF